MENNTQNLELLLIPCPAPGHIVSTAEFANRILSYHPKFQVTVLLIRSPWTNFTSPRPQQVNHPSSDRIRYIDLPEVNPPPEQLFHDCPEEFLFTYIASHKPHVRSTIDTNNSASRLAGIVVDVFSTSMIDVANDLNIPSYLFFTSSAAFLGMTLDLPSLYIQFNEDGWFSTDDSDTQLSISTFANPFPATLLPTPYNNKSRLQVFINHSKRFTETKGIIINTFSELESYAANSLSRQILPPLYTIGPVLDLKGQAHGQHNNITQKQRIMKWLDNQPDSSVIFLCFGSGGSFTEQQLTEIANGLQQTSGRIRFLWSLRKPPTSENIAKPGEYTDEEVNRILPNGFISSLTEGGRGMVCGWAPQVEVLAHKAVGGFVSHCGWNSTLESLWFGKPIVTWPIYAEQHCNAFQIVKELGLGVELRLDYRKEKGDVVMADEIGKAVKCVMDDRELRKRVEEIEVISKRVLMDGGSSFKAMECLVKDIETNLGD